MLDYFQAPVAVTREQDFLQAVARNINGEASELSQAPDHYEVWQIGEIDDQGHITANRQFLANCSSLIRNGVWGRRATGADPAQNLSQPIPMQPGGRPGRAGADPNPHEGTKQTTNLKAPQPPQDAGRSNTGDQSLPRE